MNPPSSSKKIDPDLFAGQPYPLGATLTKDGVNFSIFSANATSVDLCLFAKPEDGQPNRQIRIFHCTNQIWHVFVPGLKAGQCYGYRVDGPFEPSQGHRFNPSKLLLDPYAKAISGGVKWNPAMFSYPLGDPLADLSKDENDNAAFMPKSVVIDHAFDWKGDEPLNMDYTGTGNTLAVYLPNPLQLVMDSLRYWIKEMHVDGFRFDLAATLVRELHEVNQLSSFFDVIHQDPLISQVNNNAYCQDNEISWLKWERDEHSARLTRFVSKLTAFRKQHPVFRRLDFFRGKAVRGSKFKDVAWLNSEGRTMTDIEWNSCHRCMEVFLSGHLTGIDGKVLPDDFFLICFNAHHEPVTFTPPMLGADAKWELLLDTANEEGFLPAQCDISEKFTVEARSLSILRLKAPESLDRATVMRDF